MRRSRFAFCILYFSFFIFPSGMYAGDAAVQGIPAFFMGDGWTGEKPQSKCWYFDGSWWCILPGEVSERTAHRFYRLEGARWQRVGSRGDVVDKRAGARADVLCRGDSLFVLSFHPRETRFLAYRYDRRKGVYRRLKGFPVRLAPLPLEGVETMVLTRDGSGRFWAVCEGERAGAGRGEVRVFWSEDAAGRRWNREGVRLGDDVHPDDIATAFRFSPSGEAGVGVCWSRQSASKSANRDSAGISQILMRVHRDGDPPDVWGEPETAASGVALADDHLNTAVAPDGTVYLVTKTSLDDLEPKDPVAPQLMLYARSPEGRWSAHPVSPCVERGARPIVVLEERAMRLHVFYTQPVDDGRVERRIVHRFSGARKIAFSDPPTVVIAQAGVYLNDATSTKQNVTVATELLVMCGGRDGKRKGPRRAYYRVLKPGGG